MVNVDTESFRVKNTLKELFKPEDLPDHLRQYEERVLKQMEEVDQQDIEDQYEEDYEEVEE